MKNLVFVAAGDRSLHHSWADGVDRNFDVMVAYYGHGEGKIDGYRQCRFKGTKFKIFNQAYQANPDFDDYDAILVLDDDLFITTKDVNRFFDIFHEYDLWIAQPSVCGWYSVIETLPVAGNLLRFTNWVEIMCPCFGKGIVKKCSSTFTENNSDWGIENVWRKILDYPKDKIAIIDDVSVVHTRPCFFGDTYYLNNNTNVTAFAELEKIIEDHGVFYEIIVYKEIKIDHNKYYQLPSEDRFFPPVDSMKKKVSSLRQKPFFMA